MSGWGQNYVRLEDVSGFEFSQSDLDSLEQVAEELKNILPTDIKDKFLTIDVGYFSFNKIMSGPNSLEQLWENIISTKKQDTETPYFLLFGRYIHNNKLSNMVYFHLPLEGFNSCFTESFYNTLNNTLMSYCNNEIVKNQDYAISIKETIKYCTKKLNKILYCCENGLRSEECSVCNLTIEEISADLEAKGYFELSTIFDLCEHSKFNVTLNTKEYLNINSEVEIIFSNPETTYNFTDALEDFLNDKNNYEVNVKIYDDNISSQDICYEEEVSLFNKNGLRNTIDYNQNIVVLNYFDEKKVYVKLDVEKKPCDPLPVYLADKSHEENDQFKRFTKSELYKLMDITFNHCQHIYDKNGFANLFAFAKIKTNEELDALVMDDFNIIYFFRDQNGHSCVQGVTEFYLPNDFGLALNKDAWNNCERYGSTINLVMHDVKGQPFQLGFTLAHEILHVLTIRGARLMKMPQRDFCNEIHINNCGNGGHLNDKENLLCGGDFCIGDAPPKSPYLHNKETIDHRALYLMMHYLYKKVY